MQEQPLHDWVASHLAVEPAAISLTQIAGDASPRQYFRVTRPRGALSDWFVVLVQPLLPMQSKTVSGQIRWSPRAHRAVRTTKLF